MYELEIICRIPFIMVLRIRLHLPLLITNWVLLIRVDFNGVDVIPRTLLVNMEEGSGLKTERCPVDFGTVFRLTEVIGDSCL